MIKAIIKGQVNLTDDMDGTTVSWMFDTFEVFVNGVSTAFSYSNGVITIPSYTSGVVFAKFQLFVTYSQVDVIAPKDPLDDMSDKVYWENRLTKIPTISNSIKKFETGYNEISVGAVSIRIDDSWRPLFQNRVTFSNSEVLIYKDDSFIAKLITSKDNNNDTSITLNSQITTPDMRRRVDFGDPSYLNRIDRTSSNAFYTGSNIPEQFDGWAIPMFIGSISPYELVYSDVVDTGIAIAASPPAQVVGKMVNGSNFICRVIPTSNTTGILGRMPTFQSTNVNSVDQTDSAPGEPRIASRLAGIDASSIADMLPGSQCILEYSAGGTYRGRLLSKSGTIGSFYIDRNNTDAGGYYDRIRQTFTGSLPLYRGICDGAIGTFNITETATPGGNKFLTCTLTGYDMVDNDDELFIVFEDISGYKTSIENAEWILNQHNITTDSSFATLAGTLTSGSIMQVGFQNNDFPTVGDLVAEINKSLLTAIILPQDGTDASIVEINADETALVTIDEEDISKLNVKNEYRKISKTTVFEPLYMRDNEQRAGLYVEKTVTSTDDIYNSNSSTTVNHVLDERPTRFYDIAKFNANPETIVKFTCLNDSIVFDIGDTIQVNHSNFIGKLFVVGKSEKDIGFTVEGRHIYDN